MSFEVIVSFENEAHNVVDSSQDYGIFNTIFLFVFLVEGAYSSIEDFDFSKVKAPTSKNPLMKKNSNSSSYANVGGRYVVASFDYVPQGPQELELKTGDKIEVLRVEDTDWGIGKLRGNTGAFPLSFTEPQK
eukprot:TCONS_00032999-protein